MSDWYNQKEHPAPGQMIVKECQPPTKREQLSQQRFQLQLQLDKVDAAIAALDAHPELEQFIDTLQKAGI